MAHPIPSMLDPLKTSKIHATYPASPEETGRQPIVHLAKVYELWLPCSHLETTLDSPCFWLLVSYRGFSQLKL